MPLPATAASTASSVVAPSPTIYGPVVSILNNWPLRSNSQAFMTPLEMRPRQEPVCLSHNSATSDSFDNVSSPNTSQFQRRVPHDAFNLKRTMIRQTARVT